MMVDNVCVMMADPSSRRFSYLSETLPNGCYYCRWWTNGNRKRCKVDAKAESVMADRSIREMSSFRETLPQEGGRTDRKSTKWRRTREWITVTDSGLIFFARAIYLENNKIISLHRDENGQTLVNYFNATKVVPLSCKDGITCRWYSFDDSFSCMTVAPTASPSFFCRHHTHFFLLHSNTECTLRLVIFCQERTHTVATDNDITKYVNTWGR